MEEVCDSFLFMCMLGKARAPCNVCSHGGQVDIEVSMQYRSDRDVTYSADMARLGNHLQSVMAGACRVLSICCSLCCGP